MKALRDNCLCTEEKGRSKDRVFIASDFPIKNGSSETILTATIYFGRKLSIERSKYPPSVTLASSLLWGNRSKAFFEPRYTTSKFQPFRNQWLVFYYALQHFTTDAGDAYWYVDV